MKVKLPSRGDVIYLSVNQINSLLTQTAGILQISGTPEAIEAVVHERVQDPWNACHPTRVQ